MKIEQKFLLKLNLQNFADGLLDFDDDNVDNNDAEVDLTDDDYEEQRGPEYGDEPEDDGGAKDDGGEGEPPKEPEQAAEEPKPEDKTPPVVEDKKVQTPEENAKFAEQRRQKQLQAELDRLKAESPEFKLAQSLAELYGEKPEVLLERAEQAKVAKIAKETGKTVEQVQEERRRDAEIENLRLELAKVQYQGWQQRVDSEAETLKKEYPALTDEDLKTAQRHLLQSGNVDASLEEAVYALHGKKIAAAIKESARQEALAELSGRKPGPVIGAGNKSANDAADALTPAERAVARAMGISDADYIKYKI